MLTENGISLKGLIIEFFRFALLQLASQRYRYIINVLVDSLASASSKEPWKLEGDTDERNERARHAYSAVLTVTSPAPEEPEYLEFSDQVKLFDYTYKE